MKWYIHIDRDESEFEGYSDDRYSITTNRKYRGWNTDSGQEGYGLSKELAQWICDKLNECGEEPPFIMNRYGTWEEKKDTTNEVD